MLENARGGGELRAKLSSSIRFKWYQQYGVTLGLLSRLTELAWRSLEELI
jgi:hypothetical protein